MNETIVWIISAVGIVVTILMYAGGIAESNRQS